MYSSAFSLFSCFLTSLGNDYPAGMLSDYRISSPIPHKTLWLSPGTSHHDDGLEHGLYVRHFPLKAYSLIQVPLSMGAGMDDQQDVLLCHKSLDWRLRGRVHPWDNPFRNILLQVPRAGDSLGVVLGDLVGAPLERSFSRTMT